MWLHEWWQPVRIMRKKLSKTSLRRINVKVSVGRSCGNSQGRWGALFTYLLSRLGILEIIAMGISCLRDLHSSSSKLCSYRRGGVLRQVAKNKFLGTRLSVSRNVSSATYQFPHSNRRIVYSESTVFKSAELVLKTRPVTFGWHLLFLNHTVLFH